MKNFIAIASFVFLVLLLQGCGQNEPSADKSSAGSFSAAEGKLAVVQTEVQVEQPEQVDKEEKQETQETQANETDKENKNTTPKAADSKPATTTDAVVTKEDAATKEAAEAAAATKEKPSEAKESQKPVKVDNKAEAAEAKNIKPAAEKSSTGEQQAKETTITTNSKLQVNQKKSAEATSNISWSGFFDGDDQTTPSEQFWDLSGSTVTIKGFMGEVLSFEKNWFLLIPEPGAECPFDNGDETYWNKIMIVFVPDDVKLRYTSEAIEITGRLDVGIKIDESGYKTMFRLYDAAFKEIKDK